VYERDRQLGEQTIQGQGIPPWPYSFINRKFSVDLVGDLMSMQNMANEPEPVRCSEIPALIWAECQKADDAKNFPTL